MLYLSYINTVPHMLSPQSFMNGNIHKMLGMIVPKVPQFIRTANSQAQVPSMPFHEKGYPFSLPWSVEVQGRPNQ